MEVWFLGRKMGICLSAPVKISSRGVVCIHVGKVGLEVVVVEMALERVETGNGLSGGERSGAGHIVLDC